MGRESTNDCLLLSLSENSLGQRLIHRSPVSYGHEANDSSLVIDRIDDAKAANAILT